MINEWDYHLVILHEALAITVLPFEKAWESRTGKLFFSSDQW
jgi:hypothetical protein